MRRRLIIALLFVVLGYSIFAIWRGSSNDSVLAPTPNTAETPPAGPASARSQGDSITVTSLAGTGLATMVLDSRRAGACFDKEIHRTATTITVQNVETAATCISRLFVMAVDNALQRIVPAFTDSGGDVVTVAMSPVAKLPVAVWIAHGSPQNAQVDINTATLLYNGMQCGVTFAPVSMTDRRSAPGVSSLAENVSCNDVSALKSTVGFTAGQLNVYYIGQIYEPEGARGIACPADGGVVDVVLVANVAVGETLAHEIGHTFTLEHSNGLAVPITNLMLRGAPERDSLTTGQCVRANLNPKSSITLAGPRPTSVGCAPELADDECPALVFDVNSQQ